MKKVINQFIQLLLIAIQLLLIAFITNFLFGVVVRMTKFVGGL